MGYVFLWKAMTTTAQKLSVFGVILVRIFPEFSQFNCGKLREKCGPEMRENAGKMRARITPNTDSFLRSVQQSDNSIKLSGYAHLVSGFLICWLVFRFVLCFYCVNLIFLVLHPQDNTTDAFIGVLWLILDELTCWKLPAIDQLYFQLKLKNFFPK